MDDQKQNIDKNLLTAIQAGDERAFKTLFLEYYQKLCNFAYTYVGCTHKSEEIVQEVFANFWESKNQISHSKNIRAYLFISVKNKTLDTIKKEKTEREYISMYALENKGKTYQNELPKEKSDFVEQVQIAVDNLPKRAKSIYILSRREGLTYKEIAKVLDISVKTVESQMVRSLKFLRKHLEKFVALVVVVTSLPI